MGDYSYVDVERTGVGHNAVVNQAGGEAGAIVQQNNGLPRISFQASGRQYGRPLLI